MKRVKAQIDPLTKVIGDFEDASLAYEMSKEAGDEDLLTEADEQLHACSGGWTSIEMQSLLSGKHDHRDCFFTISAGDGGTEANDWARCSCACTSTTSSRWAGRSRSSRRATAPRSASRR
jgi:peptide chain release factor 2